MSITSWPAAPNSEVNLVSGDTTINATSVDFRDSSLLYAKFDLTDRTVGTYDVKLTVGAQTATLVGGFAVVPGQSGGLDVQVTTPEFVRFGREGKLAVEYVNTSTNDMVAPLLRITADKALFKSEGRPNFESDEIYVLGISSSGPAGIGDHATLSSANGVYTLAESDSTVWRFRADGLLDFWQEGNGNRVTSGYTSGKLTSLTHSSGAAIMLQYNPQGRISQLTDPAGRIVTYACDASGEHLTSYTDKYGTHGYTCVTGQGPPREHALASIDYSDDTHVLYSYDPVGRLIAEQRDDGSTVPIQYEYGASPPGTTAVAD